MEKINQQPDSKPDSIESEDEKLINNNLLLLKQRIRSCSTVSDTHLYVDPNTGEFLSIGDGVVPENSGSVAITIGQDIPDISDVFFGSQPKFSRNSIMIVQESINQWNESFKK